MIRNVDIFMILIVFKEFSASSPHNVFSVLSRIRLLDWVTQYTRSSFVALWVFFEVIADLFIEVCIYLKCPVNDRYDP